MSDEFVIDDFTPSTVSEPSSQPATPVTKQVMVLPGELIEVQRELERQHKKWGEQNHADGTGSQDYKDAAVYYRQRCDFRAKQGKVTWADILLEELFEAMAESDEEKLLGELTQIAAVAVQWQLSVRRRQERRAAEYEAQLQTLRDLSVPPVPNPSVSIQSTPIDDAVSRVLGEDQYGT